MSTHEKYKGKGLTGLTNVGNSCYMNACLQILSHTYVFNEVLDTLSEDKISSGIDGNLLREWNNLRKLMWSANCVINPRGWINAVHTNANAKDIHIFSGFDQNDLPEFLLFITESFHNALKRDVDMKIKGSIKTSTDKLAYACYNMLKANWANEYSEILKIFYGVHVSRIVSLHGTVLSTKPEPFFIIDLPIPHELKEPSIYDCFDAYTKAEHMVGDNAWMNDSTGVKEDVRKDFIYWSLPEILVISLKRFTNSNMKDQRNVIFPVDNLDMKTYVYGYEKKGSVYELYGICNQSGSCLGGHYTAYVKNANMSWYHFNDTSVTLINDTSKLMTPKAYCLFYKKKIR